MNQNSDRLGILNATDHRSAQKIRIAPEILLNLKALKLPTFLRENGKLARQYALGRTPSPTGLVLRSR